MRGDSITKNRFVKSRKKLSESEAYGKIEQIAMQLQSESEKMVFNLIPNKGKKFEEIDAATRFCLLADGVTSIEQAIEVTQQEVIYLMWKVQEDYARYLSPGVHHFVTGLKVIKKSSESEKEEGKFEQMELFS